MKLAFFILLTVSLLSMASYAADAEPDISSHHPNLDLLLCCPPPAPSIAGIGAQIEKRPFKKCPKKREPLVKWTSAEDRLLEELVTKYGPRWSLIVTQPEGLSHRTRAQCRKHWAKISQEVYQPCLSAAELLEKEEIALETLREWERNRQT